MLQLQIGCWLSSKNTEAALCSHHESDSMMFYNLANVSAPKNAVILTCDIACLVIYCLRLLPTIRPVIEYISWDVMKQHPETHPYNPKSHALFAELQITAIISCLHRLWLQSFDSRVVSVSDSEFIGITSQIWPTVRWNLDWNMVIFLSVITKSKEVTQRTVYARQRYKSLSKMIVKQSCQTTKCISVITRKRRKLH